MLKVLSKSTDPCFICKTHEKVAMVKGDSFSLALCMTHLWEKLPAPKDQPNEAANQAKAADGRVNRLIET